MTLFSAATFLQRSGEKGDRWKAIRPGTNCNNLLGFLGLPYGVCHEDRRKHQTTKNGYPMQNSPTNLGAAKRIFIVSVRQNNVGQNVGSQACSKKRNYEQSNVISGFHFTPIR